MTSYWIFIYSQYTDFVRGNTEELFSRLRKTLKWAIGPRTPNRNKLQKGDLVVFYETGSEGDGSGKRFMGTAMIESALQSPGENDQFPYVRLSNLIVWTQPVALDKVALKLSFVKSKDKLHYYFQTGVKSITSEDFELIKCAAEYNTQ